MRRAEETILTVAEIVRDSAAMNDAALASDMDEARFRALLIASKADAAGLVDVALAAAYLATILGPVNSEPQPGYGAAMLRVANELERVGFEPL